MKNEKVVLIHLQTISYDVEEDYAFKRIIIFQCQSFLFVFIPKIL